MFFSVRSLSHINQILLVIREYTLGRKHTNINTFKYINKQFLMIILQLVMYLYLINPFEITLLGLDFRKILAKLRQF